MDKTQELAALYARLDDLSERSAKGEMGISDFLSPRECFFAENYLRARGTHFFSFGGYAAAERRKIYILPEYMDEVQGIEGILDYGLDVGIGAISIKPSGYRVLTHRDYLGALLGLGIERSVVGDILVFDSGEAVVLCESGIGDFLCAELLWVANDKVKVRSLELDSVEIPERRFEAINDTVASPRLDCVVGALCSLSREKAKQTITSGLVEVDFLCEERPDRAIDEGVLLSVRGYGRYRILSLSDKTKKGRYRLLAEKFI